MKQAISTTKVPLRNDRNEIFGVAGISRDITERKLADALHEGQAQILEMIAMSAPLGDVLERLVLLIESQFKGIFGSVQLLDETGPGYGTAPRRACRIPTTRRSTACPSVPKRDRAARPRIGGKPSSSPTS